MMSANSETTVAMKLEGNRVTIRPMKVSDLEVMYCWRPFADPLYQPFDFPRRSRIENRRWFEWRNQDAHRRMYTIENENREVIGSLTLRDIDNRRSALLGITLGADFVSRGYGTEALRLFLDYYFFTMGFARLVLDVAATNLRAVRCYRSLGFLETSQHYRAASHASYQEVHQNARYYHLRAFFQRVGLGYNVLFYDMALSREDWLRFRENQDPA